MFQKRNAVMRMALQPLFYRGFMHIVRRTPRSNPCFIVARRANDVTKSIGANLLPELIQVDVVFTTAQRAQHLYC